MPGEGAGGLGANIAALRIEQYHGYTGGHCKTTPKGIQHLDRPTRPEEDPPLEPLLGLLKTPSSSLKSDSSKGGLEEAIQVNGLLWNWEL